MIGSHAPGHRDASMRAYGGRAGLLVCSIRFAVYALPGLGPRTIARAGLAFVCGDMSATVYARWVGTVRWFFHRYRVIACALGYTLTLAASAS